MGIRVSDLQLEVWRNPGGLDWGNIGRNHLDIGMVISEITGHSISQRREENRIGKTAGTTYIAQVPVDQYHEEWSVLRITCSSGNKRVDTSSGANIKYFLEYKS